MERIENLIPVSVKNKLKTHSFENFVGEENTGSGESYFLDGIFGPKEGEEKKEFSETKVGGFLEKNSDSIGNILGGLLSGGKQQAPAYNPPPPEPEKKIMGMPPVIFWILIVVILLLIGFLLFRKK